MKSKGSSIFLTLMICAALILTSCTGKTDTAGNSAAASDVSQDPSTQSSDQTTQDTEQALQSSEPSALTQTSHSTVPTGIYPVVSYYGLFLGSAGAPHGLYQIIIRENDLCNIVYTDYSTNQQSFLCNDPSCDHTSDSCPSYLGKSYNVGTLVYVNNKLLFFSGTTTNGETRQKIEIIEGYKRRVLVEFNSNLDINFSQPCTDDKRMYFNAYEKMDGGSYNPCIYVLDLQTGDYHKLMDRQEGEYLADGAGNTIFLMKDYFTYASIPAESQPAESQISVDQNDAEESAGAVVSGIEDNDYDVNWHYQYIKIDLSTPEEREVVDEWTDEEKRGILQGGIFYYYDAKDDCFYSHNFMTGEKVSVANTTAFKNDLYCERLVDGKLLVRLSVVDEEGFKYVAVDFAEGSISEFSPLILQGDEPMPIILYGTYEDKIFVQYVNRANEEDWSIEVKMGYLTFDDFFAGKGNYVPTDMVYEVTY